MGDVMLLKLLDTLPVWPVKLYETTAIHMAMGSLVRQTIRTMLHPFCIGQISQAVPPATICRYKWDKN